MLPDRVSNPGPLTYESGALLIAQRGPVGSVVLLQLLRVYELSNTVVAVTFLPSSSYIYISSFIQKEVTSQTD